MSRSPACAARRWCGSHSGARAQGFAPPRLPARPCTLRAVLPAWKSRRAAPAGGAKQRFFDRKTRTQIYPRAAYTVSRTLPPGALIPNHRPPNLFSPLFSTTSPHPPLPAHSKPPYPQIAMNHLSTSLTRAQEQVVAPLSDGLTTAAAAAKGGIHRNTITNWRRTSPEFRDALESARQERSLLIRENADALVALSFDTVRTLLQDPSAPAGVRLKAALSIINIASASTGFVSQISQTPQILPNPAQSRTTAPPLPPDSCLLTPDSAFPPPTTPNMPRVT